MNKDEKSLIDEMWNASGLETPQKKQEDKPQTPAPKPEKPKKEKTKKEKPKKEKKPKKEHDPAEKKKDIKFLVLYTTVFVVVISGLIAGSYMITSRIHKQMAESDAEINMNQSTLTNIQNERDRLQAENGKLKDQATAAEAARKESEDLLATVSDMVEQDGLLIAAQNAFINGNKEDAAEIFSVIDREKLSETNKTYYDALKEKLV